MPTPNYQYDKRQRERAKKQKKEEKQQRKLERKTPTGQVPAPDEAADRPPAPTEPK
ncbi:MAG TPA: hypothetical protein VM491_16790 [Burkholderiaceae bacterium]|nr:hypothetical protein [Burkholderiaceae bacterium]